MRAAARSFLLLVLIAFAAAEAPRMWEGSPFPAAASTS